MNADDGREQAGDEDLVQDAVPLHAVQPGLHDRGADQAADERVR